jgi:spermidine/putrescine transport system ATP-binding protein
LEIAVARAAWPGAATRAVVSVRPEKVCIAREPVAGAENGFQATITEEIFQGALDRLVVRTDAGTTFSVVVANESAMMEAFHEGERVWCGLHIDDLVVVPAA